MMHSRNTSHPLSLPLFALARLAVTGTGATGSAVDVPEREKTATAQVLEAGSDGATGGAADGLDIYPVGFHRMKADPSHQMDGHHFCRQANEGFAQCARFDGNTAGANLNGIEYIISERLFERLHEAEKSSGHPDNDGILSGLLAAPGLPEVAEAVLTRSKMNSYGTIWHI
jgi:hypothetical protein